MRAHGPGSTELKAGDWVFCELTIRSRGDAADTLLQADLQDPALPLHRLYHNGAYAEQMVASPL